MKRESRQPILMVEDMGLCCQYVIAGNGVAEAQLIEHGVAEAQFIEPR